MLITKLKPRDTLKQLTEGRKVFTITCEGCREICFSERDPACLQEVLKGAGALTGSITTDYICDPEYLPPRLERHLREIEEADVVLVMSCGVGVQTAADVLVPKRVYAACDTYSLPGAQGVTPLEYGCGQCGECYLNLTGGICPITACSKGLINGPCGGAKNGMCEVEPDMKCGWEQIYRRLAQLGCLDLLRDTVRIRNFAAGDRRDV